MTKESEQYVVGAWHGKPRYQCPLCPFDTLHEEVIRDHVAKHRSPPPQPRVVPTLVNRFGQPLTGTEPENGGIDGEN